MGISYNPRIVTDGLVLALDAGNSKGFDDDENLLTNSNISSTTWNPNSSPVLTNNSSTSPDGSVNATQIAAPATAGSGIFRTISLTLGTVYTYSVFVKAVSGSNTIYFGTDTGTTALVTVNTSTGVASLNSGSPTNITSISYPNSWYRVSFTFTASATATHSFVIYNLTASANTWLAWGAQLETGSSASPYYPTTGTAKNRGTTLIDMTGRGNNGTLLNGPTSSTDNGGVLNLDGSNDYINSYNDSNLFVDDNSLTVSIFANINEATKTGRGALVSSQRYQGEPDPGGYGLCIFDGTQLCVNLTKRILGVDNSYEGLCTFTYIRQQFKYYSFTYNNSTKTVTTYMNGVQQATSTNASYGWTLNTTNRITRIGINWQGGWGTYYNMKIGAVHIHNRALTAAEIQQNFNATRGRFGI